MRKIRNLVLTFVLLSGVAAGEGTSDSEKPTTAPATNGSNAQPSSAPIVASEADKASIRKQAKETPRRRASVSKVSFQQPITFPSDT